jgi:GH18 family chitinase
MNTSSRLVNAWIFLNEDEPAGTNYNSPDSCYQTLIKNGVYQSVDILSICFVSTIQTGSDTIPAGDGSSYTVNINPASHPGGLKNQDYINNIIRDARESNPNIKITVTMDYSNGELFANIFSNHSVSDQQNADNFAANLMAYLENYNLDGLDIDWESPISDPDQTAQSQFALLINAIGAQFKKQADRHYYLMISPAEVGSLDASSVNSNMDFVNLQLYSGFTEPNDFVSAGVNSSLFAYGAKFEAVFAGSEQGFQTAQEAFDDNEEHYHYPTFINWRLNSSNYQFEQAQQQVLYQLALGSGQ